MLIVVSSWIIQIGWRNGAVGRRWGFGFFSCHAPWGFSGLCCVLPGEYRDGILNRNLGVTSVLRRSYTTNLSGDGIRKTGRETCEWPYKLARKVGVELITLGRKCSLQCCKPLRAIFDKAVCANCISDENLVLNDDQKKEWAKIHCEVLQIYQFLV